MHGKHHTFASPALRTIHTVMSHAMLYNMPWQHVGRGNVHQGSISHDKMSISTLKISPERYHQSLAVYYRARLATFTFEILSKREGPPEEKLSCLEATYSSIRHVIELIVDAITLTISRIVGSIKTNHTLSKGTSTNGINTSSTFSPEIAIYNEKTPISYAIQKISLKW